MIGSFCRAISSADVGLVSNNLKYPVGFRPMSHFSHHWRRALCCSIAATDHLSWASQLHQESLAVGRLPVGAHHGCAFDLGHHGSCSRCCCGLLYLGKSQCYWCGDWVSRLDGAAFALPRLISQLPCVGRAGCSSFALCRLILSIVFRGLDALCFYSSLVRCFLQSLPALWNSEAVWELCLQSTELDL